MRKHHTRWVALCSAVAISTSGLVCLAGPAIADDENTRAFAWPVVSQGVSSYDLDGYELTYLPSGLDRYGINASSTTDRQGNSRSQLSWVRGPDQLYGRVTVLRGESLQEIDDLRSSRYSHLSEDSLEQLPESEAFEHGAYLSEESGDLFWIDKPGVAVATHLQPDRWKSSELVRMAEAVAEMTEEPEAEEAEEPAETTEPAPEETDEPEVAEEEVETEEPPVQEVVDQTPAEEDAPAEEETPAEEGAEEGAEDEAPTGQVPVDEAPEEEAPADETPVEESDPAEETTETEAPAQDQASEDETPEEDAPAEDAPADETPAEETDPTEETTETEAPAQNEGSEEETTDPAEADLPEHVSSREVKTCVTEHFVDFDSASSKLDHELMTPTSKKFVEKALNNDALSDDERDRLLATAWYYGHEGDKVDAVDDCAEHFDLQRGQVEDVINQVSDLIAELIQEAEEAQAEAVDQGDRAGSDAQVSDQDVSVDITDPIGADEWEELWNSLPWSIPTAQR